MDGAPCIADRPADGSTPVVHVRLKVVPGASKDHVAGPYGDRLRVRVTAAAESGKANKAVLALLAERLAVPGSSLTLVRGHGTPRKTVEVRGLSAKRVAALLNV